MPTHLSSAPPCMGERSCRSIAVLPAFSPLPSRAPHPPTHRQVCVLVRRERARDAAPLPDLPQQEPGRSAGPAQLKVGGSGRQASAPRSLACGVQASPSRVPRCPHSSSAPFAAASWAAASPADLLSAVPWRNTALRRNITDAGALDQIDDEASDEVSAACDGSSPQHAMAFRRGAARKLQAPGYLQHTLMCSPPPHPFSHLTPPLPGRPAASHEGRRRRGAEWPAWDWRQARARHPHAARGAQPHRAQLGGGHDRGAAAVQVRVCGRAGGWGKQRCNSEGMRQEAASHQHDPSSPAN